MRDATDRVAVRAGEPPVALDDLECSVICFEQTPQHRRADLRPMTGLAERAAPARLNIERVAGVGTGEELTRSPLFAPDRAARRAAAVPAISSRTRRTV